MKRAVYIVVLIFAFKLATSSNVLGASAKCTVEKVQGDKMILNCEQKSKGFVPGSKIKMKTVKKKPKKKG